MAELERYAANTDQLFSSCASAVTAAGEAATPTVSVPLHLHSLAPGCAMPVPEGAVEVVAAVVVTGDDGQPCVRVPRVATLQPFLKVRSRRTSVWESAHAVV